VDADDTLRPVGSDGHKMGKIDWYLGIVPTHEGWLRRQAERVAEAMAALRPDGLFLSFCRWPGFWELWTPRRPRGVFPEYSYDEHTLARFAQEAECALPTLEPVAAAAWIDAHERDRWTRWKCDVIAQVVRTLGEAARSAHASTQVMINTLPFATEDWNNARAEVFGQDVATLAEVVDGFEVMTYHQILMRPVSWIGERGEQVKATTQRHTYCTIQAAPLYLTGMHAAENRHERLSADEFAEAVRSAHLAGLDGVIVFTLNDLLRFAMDEHDMGRIDALWSVRG